MNLEEVFKKIIDEKIDTQYTYGELLSDLKKIDFLIAQEFQENQYFDIFVSLDGIMKAAEYAMKTYVYACLVDNKKLRISTMKAIEEMGEILPNKLRAFKKVWQEHREKLQDKE